MREKKFTSGPWKVFCHDDDLCSVEQDNNDPFQVCGLTAGESCATEVWISKEQREANAHLIASVPELLEALEDIMQLFRRNILFEYQKGQSKGTRENTCGVLNRARKALTKAYGEKP